MGSYRAAIGPNGIAMGSYEVAMGSYVAALGPSSHPIATDGAAN